MIDLHSHICFGIDDGCKTLEESVKILKNMSEAGFTDIFLTPHYIENSKQTVDNKTKKSIIAELEKEIDKHNLNINLYSGNEVYITDNIIELINADKIMTLNNSKYILIELSLFRLDNNTKSILHNIIVNGYIPIIAHPERYEYLNENLDFFEDLSKMGVLFQGNYLSLFGKYGKTPKKNLQKLLKKGLITFIGTDIHYIEELYEKKIYKELKKYLKKDELVLDLLKNNAERIIKS